MAEWTTYDSVVDTVDDWVDSGNAIDDDIETFATYSGVALKTLILDTPFASVAEGAITKVEHRIYCSLADLGVPCRLKLSPRFLGGDGTQEDVTQLLGWTLWFDITEDTNAPGSWAWSDVSALGANIVYSWGSGPTPIAQVAVVEIRVTYVAATEKNFTTSRNYYY